MLITTTLLFASLSPDVRRNSYIESLTNEPSYKVERSVNLNSVKESLYLFDSESTRLNNLIENIKVANVSNEVLNNSINILKNLPSLFLSNFNEENLYSSSYGTIVLEFYKADNSIFTIDIGKKSFGYFSESNNNIKHLEEDMSFSTDENQRKNSIKILIQDFLDFYVTE
nr:hypothetical protein [uncultured Flavobacterium sp.]